jgi:hypothetical protein
MLHSNYPLVLGPEHSTNTETSRSNAVIVCRQILKKTVSSKNQVKVHQDGARWCFSIWINVQIASNGKSKFKKKNV